MTRISQLHRSASVIAAVGGIALIAGTIGAPGESTAAPPSPTEQLAAAPDQGRVEALATATTNTYRQPDGTYEYVGYTTPVNYLADDGSWEPINNELVPAAGDVYAVENAENDYTVKIPEDAGNDPVKVTTDNQWLTFGMDGLDGTPVVDGAEATFIQADAADASEVIYEARPDGVKESIVLNQPPAAGVEYTFDLALSAGLTPHLRATGEIDILDAANRPVFAMPAPFMTDANNALSTNVSFELAQTGTGGWQLVVNPADGWLQDPARAYPVIVDPTVATKNPSTDGWISEGNQTQVNAGGAYLRVGGTSGNRRRALLKFDLKNADGTPIIPADAVISSSTLRLFLDAGLTTGTAGNTTGLVAGRVTATQTWTPGWLSWVNREYQTPWENLGGVWDTPSPVSTIDTSISNYKYIDVLQTTRRWVNEGWVNNGFIVKQDTNADKVLWFHSVNTTTANPPKFVVTYTVPDHAPNQPRNLVVTPGGSGYTTESDPSLSVAVSDPEGTPVDTTFTVMDQDEVFWEETTTTTQPAGSPSGSTATVQLPVGLLEPGADYSLVVTSASGGLTSTPLTSPLRADVFAGQPVPSPTCPECRSISPAVLFDGTIPADTSVSVSASSLPVDLDNLLAARVRVDLGSHAQAGGLGVYRDDYPTPIAPVIDYSTGAQSTLVEVIPSGDNTFGLRNYSGTAVEVTVTALSWVSAITAAEVEEDAALANLTVTEAEAMAIEAEQTPTIETEPPLDAAEIAEIGFTPELNGSGDEASCKPTSNLDGTFCIRTLSSAAELKDVATSGTTPPTTTEAERSGFSGCPFKAWRLLRKSTCAHIPYHAVWDFEGKEFDSQITVQTEIKVTTSEDESIVHWRVRLLLTKSEGHFAVPHAFRILGWCGDECDEPEFRNILTNHLSEDEPRQTLEWDFKRRSVSEGDRETGRQFFGIEMVPAGAADSVQRHVLKIPLIRCDRETYVSYPQGMGCVFVGYAPTFHLSLRDTEEDELANNVFKGILRTRSIGLGLHGNGAFPLHRLANKDKMAQNRAEARKLCRRRLRDQAGDCDEYPMRSTYQGCKLKRYYAILDVRTCHVGKIDPDQNQAGGRKLNKLYLNQRVLDGDEYYVFVHE